MTVLLLQELYLIFEKFGATYFLKLLFTTWLLNSGCRYCSGKHDEIVDPFVNRPRKAYKSKEQHHIFYKRLATFHVWMAHPNKGGPAYLTT